MSISLKLQGHLFWNRIWELSRFFFGLLIGFKGDFDYFACPNIFLIWDLIYWNCCWLWDWRAMSYISTRSSFSLSLLVLDIYEFIFIIYWLFLLWISLHFVFRNSSQFFLPWTYFSIILLWFNLFENKSFYLFLSIFRSIDFLCSHILRYSLYFPVESSFWT